MICCKQNRHSACIFLAYTQTVYHERKNSTFLAPNSLGNCCCCCSVFENIRTRVFPLKRCVFEKSISKISVFCVLVEHKANSDRFLSAFKFSRVSGNGALIRHKSFRTSSAPFYNGGSKSGNSQHNFSFNSREQMNLNIY